MDEAQIAAMEARIEAKIRAEIEAKHAKAELNQGLSRNQASAGKAENSTAIRQEYGAKVTPNGRMFGALLWDEMERGLTGTTLDADGLGTGE